MAVYYCRQYLKGSFSSSKRNIFHSAEGIEEMAVVIEPAIEENVFLNETKGQLLGALKQLSIREQNIIALKFWGDLTNRQIAHMMKLSENNVAVILFRALKRLRKILAEDGVDK
jgi:RNA polymerase sigma factor (sigma-70 family)